MRTQVEGPNIIYRVARRAADEILIYEESRLIARHPMPEGRRQRSLLDGHRRTYRQRDAIPVPHGFTGDLVTRRPLDFYEAVGRRLAVSGGAA